MASSRFLITSQTLGSAAASVTFSSIPATYTDLVVRFSARAATDTSPSSMGIKLNPDTANNSATYLRVAAGPSVVSLNRPRPDSGNDLFDRFTDTASDETSNTFSSGEVYIPSYTVSQSKPVSLFTVNEANVTTTLYSPNVGAGLFGNNAAITSISIRNLSGNMASGSSFYLYGIKNS
jgi:hypothetical protein